MRISTNLSMCEVRIQLLQEDMAGLEGVTKIVIQRQDPKTLAWKEALSRPVAKPADAAFTAADPYVATDKVYSYKVLYINAAATILKTVPLNCNVQYRGVCIGDGKGQAYLAPFNVTYHHARQTAVNYVQPFNSRFPIAIVGGAKNHEQGDVTGLFCPFDHECPVLENLTAYRHELVDFLCAPGVKLLKTFDGYMWMVHVDSGAADKLDFVPDTETVSFSWTEVAEVPTDHMMRVVEA